MRTSVALSLLVLGCSPSSPPPAPTPPAPAVETPAPASARAPAQPPVPQLDRPIEQVELEPVGLFASLREGTGIELGDFAVVLSGPDYPTIEIRREVTTDMGRGVSVVETNGRVRYRRKEPELRIECGSKDTSEPAEVRRVCESIELVERPRIYDGGCRRTQFAPAVDAVWREHQQAILECVGDGRQSSPLFVVTVTVHRKRSKYGGPPLDGHMVVVGNGDLSDSAHACVREIGARFERAAIAHSSRMPSSVVCSATYARY